MINNSIPRVLFLGCLTFSLCFGIPPIHEASTVSSGGNTSANSSYSNVSCIGQSYTTGLNTSASLRHQSGFLGALLLHPLLDTDGDGIPDEDDLDDDGDTFTDLEELFGVGVPPVVTNPYLSDSDGDTKSDGDEVLAGTNPDDPNSAFTMNVIDNGSGDPFIEWTCRSGNSYILLRGADMNELVNSPTFMGAFNPVGGVAPWFETTSSFTDFTTGGAPAFFYRVQLNNP